MSKADAGDEHRNQEGAEVPSEAKTAAQKVHREVVPGPNATAQEKQQYIDTLRRTDAPVYTNIALPDGKKQQVQVGKDADGSAVYIVPKGDSGYELYKAKDNHTLISGDGKEQIRLAQPLENSSLKQALGSPNDTKPGDLNSKPAQSNEHDHHSPVDPKQDLDKTKSQASVKDGQDKDLKQFNQYQQQQAEHRQIISPQADTQNERNKVTEQNIAYLDYSNRSTNAESYQRQSIAAGADHLPFSLPPKSMQETQVNKDALRSTRESPELSSQRKTLSDFQSLQQATDHLTGLNNTIRNKFEAVYGPRPSFPEAPRSNATIDPKPSSVDQVTAGKRRADVIEQSGSLEDRTDRKGESKTGSATASILLTAAIMETLRGIRANGKSDERTGDRPGRAHRGSRPYELEPSLRSNVQGIMRKEQKDLRTRLADQIEKFIQEKQGKQVKASDKQQDSQKSNPDSRSERVSKHAGGKPGKNDSQIESKLLGLLNSISLADLRTFKDWLTDNKGAVDLSKFGKNTQQKISSVLEETLKTNKETLLGQAQIKKADANNQIQQSGLESVRRIPTEQTKGDSDKIAGNADKTALTINALDEKTVKHAQGNPGADADSTRIVRKTGKEEQTISITKPGATKESETGPYINDRLVRSLAGKLDATFTVSAGRNEIKALLARLLQSDTLANKIFSDSKEYVEPDVVAQEDSTSTAVEQSIRDSRASKKGRTGTKPFEEAHERARTQEQDNELSRSSLLSGELLYLVREGDNLELIASSFTGVSADAIFRRNKQILTVASYKGIDYVLLFVGQKLVIPCVAVKSDLQNALAPNRQTNFGKIPFESIEDELSFWEDTRKLAGQMEGDRRSMRIESISSSTKSEKHFIIEKNLPINESPLSTVGLYVLANGCLKLLREYLIHEERYEYIDYVTKKRSSNPIKYTVSYQMAWNHLRRSEMSSHAGM
ncbi:MAG: LysM peptidoglycan-binding domain-containing protein [Candidatus Obscuribacterales bacterium]|nr:LysM peptidoglycan-binding domain-containing protein [Candidatus Obscuribacterales bacterium]